MMINYYDVVLVAIPAVFAAVTATLLTTGVEVTAAVSTGALPVLLVIGHAMFVRTPTGTPAPTQSASDRAGDAAATARPTATQQE